MPASWTAKTASVVMLHHHPLAYANGEWNRSLTSVLNQDTALRQVFVVDNRGRETRLDSAASDHRVVHLPGTYPNRAAMFNAGLAATTGRSIP